MRRLRLILFPIAILYGFIVRMRNYLFTKGYITSQSYDFPVICVGNLSVGGTGKSPMIEYLIRSIKNDYKIATLSRGYKRKTTGFLLANQASTVEDIGDEPLQFYTKFGDEVYVGVEAKRTLGIEALRKLQPQPKVILLDDAFQHRYVHAGFTILLTAYHDLYAHDFMLPAGNLREPVSGAKRASVIMVTKCPEILSKEERAQIIKKLNPKENQQVFFTTIAYSKTIHGINEEQPFASLKGEKVIVVTGIANPTSLLAHLKKQQLEFEHLKFPDHHHFRERDILKIQQQAGTKTILTTEKDFMRLQRKLKLLFYVPIQVAFLENKKEFDTEILSFIKKEETR